MGFEPSLFTWEPASVTKEEFDNSVYYTISTVSVTALSYNGSQSATGFLCESNTTVKSFTVRGCATFGPVGIYILSNPALERIDCGPLKVVQGDLYIEDNASLTTINADSLESVAGDFYCDQNGALQSVSFPALTTISKGLIFDQCDLVSCSLPVLASIGDDLTATYNASLQNISLPSLAVIAQHVFFSGCGLSVGSVNGILALLVNCTEDGSTPWNNVCNLGAGTNAAPTIGPPDGLAAKATLIARGATITVNP